ncbi:VOC family protein [Cytophagales bacterium LB-30]|uniref:VOC family protein n=1 Tax=Shiella aurantiaca TaxID=3058365 RepID=A0ABT8F1R2_9BACT|nr:VOC family protein [Shiella aurantiaca]MDN4164238.1 VOC family protein [Shiella aurantiaca]
MKLEHVAIWVSDLEAMREFYQKYFNMRSGGKYENLQKGFSSYFLSFENGARIEIMKRNDITNAAGLKGMSIGLAHIAISVGNKELVDSYTERLRKDGFTIIGEPRTTGDGYYESVILDPEGNQIEITE